MTIDKQKIRDIMVPGLMYIDEEFYLLEVTNEKNEKIDIGFVIRQLAKKAMQDCICDEKNIINSIVRPLAVMGVKPSVVASKFNPDAVQTFDSLVEKLSVVPTSWETATAGFMTGYLTSNFIRKNNIQLRTKHLDLTEEEKQTVLRLNTAATIIDFLALKQIPSRHAYAMVIAQQVATEEDLSIILSEEQLATVKRALEEEREILVEQIPDELKN